MEKVRLSVSDFIAVCNQTLEYAYPTVEIEGEVASYKVNQNKFVFFDIKDSTGSIGCFMTVWQVRMPIEDGMKVIIVGQPKLTAWGKFSITVQSIRPSGEGALKKSLDLLKEKLEKEGLFDEARKRTLPTTPTHVGVISSTQAAGYGDFIKILDDRWGGLRVEVAHVQVQGISAPDQIIRAIEYFNTAQQPPEVLVIIRGGGSADDLSAFNDEKLARTIAASRIPTLVGVGHEMDVSIADMVADRRAATPSNAAQILVPDRKTLMASLWQQVFAVEPKVTYYVEQQRQYIHQRLHSALDTVMKRIDDEKTKLSATRQILESLNPQTVLARGYALIRGDISIGSHLAIETKQHIIQAEVQHVTKK